MICRTQTQTVRPSLSLYDEKTKIQTLGNRKCFVFNPATRKEGIIQFRIVNEDLTPLLGLRDSEELKLLELLRENIATIDESLEGLEGTKAIADDILIWGDGNTIEEATSNHDARLSALLERCQQRHIKLNVHKFQLKKTELSYMGVTLTDKGVKPDPRKQDSIQAMPAPTNKEEVRRLIGVVTYLSRFSEALSTKSAPLRTLLKNDVAFTWEVNEQQAFDEIKALISSAPLLKYFNPDLPVEIQTDASSSGLGACLMQGGQPAQYASRALTETEKRYSQIE